jgi:hypothetical protein
MSCVKTSRKIDFPTPSNTQRVYATEVTLMWDHLETFEYFEIRFCEAEASLTAIGTTTENRYQVSKLDWNKDYCWQIIGHLNATDTISGPLWHFTTGNLHKALTIGITDYDTASDLSLTDDDALDMETALGHAKMNYTIDRLLNRVTESDIEGAIADINDLDENSLFTFTYAGHGGYSYSQHESYLLMSDGGRLYMSELKALLDPLPGKKVIIIDACESGNFTALPDSEQAMQIAAREINERFNRSVIDIFKTNGRTTAQPYHIMTAANISQISWENTILKNGIFSFFFLDGIGDVGENNPDQPFDSTFNADTDSNKAVTFSEAFAYTAPKVETYVNNLMGYHQSVQIYPEVSDLIITHW